MLIRKASSYLSLVKFSHTIFALPFAIIGFLAGAEAVGFEFDRWLILQVLFCMIFARSAAMAFNRWADREIDARNDRTKVREIPAGVISANAALIFTAVNSVLFVVTAWFINPLCFYLSPVALAVVLGYSYTKRFTPFSHLVLGLGLSLAPIGAYLAVTGVFALVPVLFSVAVITWVSGFDIIYSLQDEDFDRSNRLYSIPSVFGGKNALMISTALHVITSAVLLVAYFNGSLGMIYLAGWGIFTSLLVYQHTLVKPGDLSRVNAAFFTTNGMASVVFSLLFAIDLFYR
jgi:4-hydroxybenzoate polyprenyltransferase